LRHWPFPPTAEALLYGVMLLQKKIRRTGRISVTHMDEIRWEQESHDL
jgi:NADH:ubiquinone oxidoreductase subunit B-like Fe-S oxidoreductase